MSVLPKLLEERDAAQAAYDEFVKPLIESGNALSEEQETRRSELRSGIEKLDARIDEEHAKEQRNAKLAEVRKSIVSAPAAPVAEVNEPTTYGPDSPNSYFADLARSFSPAFRGHHEAVQRLTKASHEAAWEMVHGKPEARRSIERILKEELRDNGDGAQRGLVNYRSMGQTGRSELRAGMDTTSASGGSFATPIYFINEYAPYRQPGRPFIDQCNKQPLPSYGMTVYLPHVTAAAGVASQASQNTGVQETDPTAGYLSANLTTEAGEVTVSQQLLDRAGPGFEFDVLVFDQLNRAYAPVVDLFAINAALAGAGTISYTDTTGFHLNTTNGVGGFTSKVAGAKSAIRKAAGTVLPPTHLFLTEDRWEYIEAWADSQGRPVVVPNFAGPYNALAAGSASGDADVVEGRTGYKMAALPVFTDLSLPAPTVGNDQAIVANLDEVYVYEGTPVTRVLPQTLAGNLSVILQMYSYIAAIVRYPSGVQTVAGSGMSAINF